MELPEFLTREEGDYIHLTGHRIGLHHVIRYYIEGYSPEMLAAEYPTLPLALIHKVIAFYLDNREPVEAYIAAHDAEVDRQVAASPTRINLADLRRRLEAKQRATGIKFEARI